MIQSSKIPFFIRGSIFLIGLYTLFNILYITQGILVPLILATFLAVILSPVVRKFEGWKIPRTVSIIITLFIAFLILTCISIFIVSELNLFTSSLPKLIDKLHGIIQTTVTWLSVHLRISHYNINSWVNKIENDLISKSSILIGQMISTMGNVLVIAFVVPVYIFLILYYKPLMLEVIRRLLFKNDIGKAREILTEIKATLQNYLTGLFIEFVIVTLMYFTGLIFLGIDYAVLLALIAGLLNIIPYIGGIISVSIIMIIAIVTKTSSYIFYVLLLYAVIHFIDNSFIIPRIVASKVRINAFISFLVIVAGSSLWGIPGMILSIPLTAIFKLWFDRFEPAKPWALLLGSSIPSESDINEEKSEDA